MSSPLAGRLLAFDVDGTLLDPEGALRPRTVAALTAAADAGATLTLATGRDWRAAAPLLRQAPAVEYSLCINGVEVVTADGTALHAVELDATVAADAIGRVRREVPGVAVGVGIDGDLVGEPLIRSCMPPGHEQIPVVDDILDALGPGLRDVVLYHPDHRDDLDPFVEQVRGLLDLDGIEVAYTGLPMVELVPPGAGKHTGLAWLAAHLGIDQTHTVAFGDGMNDLAMLKWAGTSVAMGQANELVLDAADEVTATNADDGVAVWIEARL